MSSPFPGWNDFQLWQLWIKTYEIHTTHVIHTHPSYLGVSLPGASVSFDVGLVTGSSFLNLEK